MASWSALLTDALWRNAWGVIPLALAVAAICRVARPRPATRHMLWLMVLLCAVSPPIPGWLRSWGGLASARALAVCDGSNRETDRSEPRQNVDPPVFLTGREQSNTS